MNIQILGTIETYATRLEYDAAELGHVINVLNRSPDFRTLAEANLERAQKALKAALVAVDEGLRQIEQKRPAGMLQAAE